MYEKFHSKFSTYFKRHMELRRQASDPQYAQRDEAYIAFSCVWFSIDADSESVGYYCFSNWNDTSPTN
jgi:hypothetical protein